MIKEANGGTLTGGKITTVTTDNLGYGYIGMNANVMKIGNAPGSEESKAYRKAFATVISLFREESVENYYGDRAKVIEYPISNTSWAAPQPTDEGYEAAFSRDLNGDPIYTDGMTEEEKVAAAKTAALGFFERAVFTVEGGKVTAAPDGASLTVEALIPGGGYGDHPAYGIFVMAKQALEEIGVDLTINDLTNSSELWTGLRNQTVAIWAAAWGSAVDPDMYQIYFSGDDEHWAGGSNYQYSIDDAELNRLILEARQTTDQSYRKSLYKNCLDIIIDWAVEIPVYQRQNAVIFSTEKLDLSAFALDFTPFYGWIEEIQNITLK